MDFGHLDDPSADRRYELQKLRPIIRFASDPISDLAARPAVSLSSIVLFVALLHIPFLLPPFPFRRLLFIGINTALCCHIVRGTLNKDSGDDFALAVSVVGLLERFCDFFGCSGAPEDNKELTRKGWDGSFKDWNWKQRLYCVTEFWWNTRGIGWGWETRSRRGVGTPDSMPKSQFLAHHLRKMVLLFAIGVSLHHYYPSVEVVFQASILERILRSLACGIIVGVFLDGFYSVAAFVSVLLGVFTPQHWPPAYGSLTSCYSIRRAWGFWHQMITHMLISHGDWVAGILGCKKGSKAGWFVRLYTAFFLSGFHHSVPAWAISRTDGGSMCFFMLQAVGITIEEVIWRPLGRKLGIRGLPAKILGFVWTWTWFGLTGVVFCEGLVAIGMKPLVDWKSALGDRGWGIFKLL
ncbi:hypothetical protein BZA77DRAFT_158643 [Pyronema omphalodes]|nr:hypothetical protein BZA77DRAFT_158643 [Pyronema omphalodes]